MLKFKKKFRRQRVKSRHSNSL